MAETVYREKISGASVRVFSRGEEPKLLNILNDSLGYYADVQRTRAALFSSRFDADGCFVAEEKGVPVGWVAVTRLPRDKWFVVRYLNVRGAMLRASMVGSLLARAITYVESKKPEFLRATTPAIQPYVEVYRKFGFKPLRRDFRISWKLDDVPDNRDDRLETREITDETSDHANKVYVQALSPYWDWRTEEEGGTTALTNAIKEDRSRGARWFLSSLGKEAVGLAGIIPDYYEPGVSWFRGAFVVPEHRGKGIGSALMLEISRIAKNLGQGKMVVYTFSYLDNLAPGALLYLKSGGKIEAEYLQLSRIEASSVSGK